MKVLAEFLLERIVQSGLQKRKMAGCNCFSSSRIDIKAVHLMPFAGQSQGGGQANKPQAKYGYCHKITLIFPNMPGCRSICPCSLQAVAVALGVHALPKTFMPVNAELAFGRQPFQRRTFQDACFVGL